MPADIVIIPCRSDNYAYLMRDSDSGHVALVDAPEAAPILAALADRDWPLDTILITHHHGDHVEGVAEIRGATGARVIGAAADAARLPPLDSAVHEGDTFALGALEAHVYDVSGHTVGHIAFHVPAAGAVFTADSLMTLGCGRLFEGTADMMWDSLSKLAALPAETLVYTGHEYTQANARFAVTVDPDNPDLKARVEEIDRLRAQGKPTVPTSLATELATNPFLRAADPAIRAHLGMETASDVQVFAEIRARKDRF